MTHLTIKKILLGTSLVTFVGFTNLVNASEQQDDPYVGFSHQIASSQQQLVDFAKGREAHLRAQNQEMREIQEGLYAELGSLKEAHSALSTKHQQTLAQHESAMGEKTNQLKQLRVAFQGLQESSVATGKMIASYVAGKEAVEAELGQVKSAFAAHQETAGVLTARLQENERAIAQEREGYNVAQAATQAQLQALTTEKAALDAKLESIRTAMTQSEIWFNQDGTFNPEGNTHVNIPLLLQNLNAALNPQQKTAEQTQAE